MSTPLLATKLYIPPSKPNVVRRPRLIERLNDSLRSGRTLTLISAPAGFGKTTLVSNWIGDLRVTNEDLGLDAAQESQIVNRAGGVPAGKSLIVNRVAWVSLDEGDNNLTRFIAYLVGALQTVAEDIGDGVLQALQSSQPPPAESLLTALLNDIAILSDRSRIVLVLDDYHVIDTRAVDEALTFLIQHLPPQMHLVIATREDPQFPLARLRARGQLTELRAADLRFTLDEAAEFLTQVMGITLSAEDVATLETRTEGWIAGLQLAAISMQGQEEVAGFIESFTGSHRFVLDYLLEEVLHQQSERVQDFLLKTAILDRLCGPLCDAVLGRGAGETRSTGSGQETLEYLERANLFIVPLDDERRWYRYHHLFADLLRQRLHHTDIDVDDLHRRASQWYEDNGLNIEALRHAAAGNDVERAARLVEGDGMPLQFRGAVAPVLNWLASLPAAALDARPSLWVMYASALSMAGQTSGVEEKLEAAEAALDSVEPDDTTRNLVGHIAAIRALLAVVQYDVETAITQSEHALEYLHPDNLAVRTATIWKLGFAYQLQGDRDAAGQAYREAISISEASGNTIINISSTLGLAQIQEADLQLHRAAETYRRVLELAGDPPLPIAGEAHLGLARICYEWNDLDAAQQHGNQGVKLARQIENTDRFIACEVFLVRLKLAQGDGAGAAALLAKAERAVRRHTFVHRIPDVATARVLTLLHQGKLDEAAELAQTHDLPLSQARVHLAQGDPSAALAVLAPRRRQVEAKDWTDERLNVMVLQSVAHHANDEVDAALHLLDEALVLAQPAGIIRTFVDEGKPMARLLFAAAARGIAPDYTNRLLDAFPNAPTHSHLPPQARRANPTFRMIDPLSERELEILGLLAEGLSNREISERLFIAVSTVKGHNSNIYGKLQVSRRTEAVARARELDLL